MNMRGRSGGFLSADFSIEVIHAAPQIQFVIWLTVYDFPYPRMRSFTRLHTMIVTPLF